MNEEYISRLLYLLDNHTSERELTDALEEMSESGSEIFMYPVLNSYRKFKHTPISHCFLSVLGAINTPRAIAILKDIFSKEDTKRVDKLWILPFFAKSNQFEEEYVNYCIEQLLKLSSTGIMENEDSDEYDLPVILSFLRSSKRLGENIKLLELILFDPSQRRAIRKIFLFYWMREEPNEKLQYLIVNYDKIKDDDLDIILAEELKGWKGSKVEALIKLVKEKGYPRAKEILEKSEKEKQKINIQRKEDQYPNIDLIKEITALRSEVNFLSQENKNLGFKIFADSENLFKQQEAVSNKDTLVALCIDLRDIIQNIVPEATVHSMDLDEAKKHIPGITGDDLKKSLNALHLDLVSKGIVVPQDLFGFKKINKAVSLIAAHPSESRDLIKILTSLGFISSFKDGNWQEVHTGLLKLYKQSLEKLLKTLEK
jgi:ribosomal protein S8